LEILDYSIRIQKFLLTRFISIPLKIIHDHDTINGADIMGLLKSIVDVSIFSMEHL
jgi:hypothetical protein